MRALLLLTLVAPVPGEVTRGFDPGLPYEGGRHRGVDVATAPGTPVRAACSGPVVFAGRIAGDGIVTLRCGPWRVTHMPLETIAARGSAAQGAVIGTAGASSAHEGLHLGMRRDGTRFGYVDPLRFMAAPTTPVPPGRAPPARIVRPPGLAPRIVRPASPPLAPWPAWAGLALVLAGAGVRARRVRTRWSARRSGSVTVP